LGPSNNVLDIAERFKPNTVLWTFHAIQPFSFALKFKLADNRQLQINKTNILAMVLVFFAQNLAHMCKTSFRIMQLVFGSAEKQFPVKIQHGRRPPA